MDEILKLQHDFDEAELHADAGRLRSLLADDFRSIVTTARRCRRA